MNDDSNIDVVEILDDAPTTSQAGTGRKRNIANVARGLELRNKYRCLEKNLDKMKSERDYFKKRAVALEPALAPSHVHSHDIDIEGDEEDFSDYRSKPFGIDNVEIEVRIKGRDYRAGYGTGPTLTFSPHITLAGEDDGPRYVLVMVTVSQRSRNRMQSVQSTCTLNALLDKPMTTMGPTETLKPTMLLLAAIFLLHFPFSCGMDGNEAANMGKLATTEKTPEVLRYFVNVTFDWSSRKYGDKEIRIPECHEKRIRRSYYDLSFFFGPIVEVRSGIVPEDLRTGHLVFPLVITAVNATMPRREYFAVAVHKLIGRDARHLLDHLFPFWKSLAHMRLQESELFIKIVIVSEATWRSVWSLWERAIEEGNTLCNGGKYFDQLLPIIQEEEKTTPQYDDIVQDYTEITSEVCGAVRCGTPSNQSETVSLAYPTDEGKKLFERPENYQRPVTRKGGYAEWNVYSVRRENDEKMWNCVRDHYNNKEIGRFFMKESVAGSEMSAREEVFRPMYRKEAQI